MESVYYVTHPQIGRTAVVYAPSTEKARTTFLDWLERSGLVSRRDRQAFRKDMVAKRLEDPNVPVDVELHYGYESDIPSYGLPTEMEESEVQESIETPVESSEDFIEATPQASRPLMPIQEVMLRGYK